MEWVQYIHRNFYTTSFYIDTISNPINILLDLCSILKVHNIIWSLRIWIVALFGMCCVLGKLSVDFFVCCRWACRLGVLGVPTRWVLGVRYIEDGIYVWYFYPSFRYCTCISVPPLLPFWLVYSIWKKNHDIILSLNICTMYMGYPPLWKNLRLWLWCASH